MPSTTRDIDSTPEPDWTPIEGVTEPAQIMELRDIDSMLEVTHPIRGTVLRRLKHPQTVAEVANSMDVPVTRLYHHVHRLMQFELIRIVATRQVAAVTERRYQVVAREFRLHRDVFNSPDRNELAQAIGSVFDQAKLGLQRLAEAGGFTNVTDPHDHSFVSLGEAHLTLQQRNDLFARLAEVVTEFRSEGAADADPDTERTTLFVAAFPDADSLDADRRADTATATATATGTG